MDALLGPTAEPGRPTRLRPGIPADRLLHAPRTAALADPHRDAVRLVLVDGRAVAGR